MTVVGVATNSTEALRQARELSPDVALVDISLGTEISGRDQPARPLAIRDGEHRDYIFG